MVVTNVYMSNLSIWDFPLSLSFSGPSTVFQSSFSLLQNSIAAGAQNVKVMSIDRTPSQIDNTTEAELRVSFQNTFIGAYKIVLGGALNTPIYWGIRAPVAAPGEFRNDHTLIQIEVPFNTRTFLLTLQGRRAAGFDDIYVTVDVKLDTSAWMANAGATRGNTPLEQWFIPGTHDSGTSSITSSSAWAPDAEWFHLSKTLVAKWAKTQSNPVAGQLQDGIRYFDFRVAAAASGSGYAFVHSLEGDPVTPALQAVRDFILNSHSSKEIIILDFNKFYSATTFDHKAFVKIIMDMLSPYMISPSVGTGVTPNQIWQTGGRVIVTYADDATVNQHPNQLWRRQSAATSAISSPWANTNDISVLIPTLGNYITRRVPNKFFVLQCILTPTVAQIANFLSDLKTWATTVTNPAVATQFRNIWRHQNTNIIMVDFYEESNIVAEVISANM